MKFLFTSFFGIALAIFFTMPVFSQENEPVVIDQVIAQVNDGVITLSKINRETKDAVQTLLDKGKTADDAKLEIDGKQGELIANLILEELILQKAKEEGVDADADTQVNRNLVDLMKQYSLKNLEALSAAMKTQNIDIEEFKDKMRKQISKDLVLQREVDSKIYWNLSSKELKDYFEKNKDKFTKPETVTLSEIFLNFAGRDETAVRAKAKLIIEQARNGADFEKLALENSDNPEVKTNKGKVGSMPTNDLNEKIAAPIKATKAGGVTDPIDVEGGIEIIKVAERSEPTKEAFFDEEAVRKAITYEKIPAARKKFLADLRNDAYIEIADTYRAKVMPFLIDKDSETAEAAKPSSKKSGSKKGNTKKKGQ